MAEATGVTEISISPEGGSSRGKPEEQVRQQVLKELRKLGWKDDRLRWKPEWTVPDTPHDLSKREAGQKYAICGYSDLVAFADDSQEWHALQVIFEFKKPEVNAGRSQLMRYLSNEPAARMGYWTNGTASLALYKRPDGQYQEVQNPPLPRPEDDLTAPSRSLLKWGDLREPKEANLTAAMKRLLVTTVAGDTRSTRRDEQLNQLCNVVLVKLESDAAGEAAPAEPVPFQMIGSELERVELTAARVREQFRELYNRRRTDIFTNDDSSEIKLDDHTLYEAVVELSGYRLLYVPVEVVAKAFQIFRTKALKSEEGQYFTPQRVIKSAIAAMDLDYSDKIIDPACGTGGFLLEAVHAIKERHAPDDARKHLLIKWANEKVFGVDLDAINVKLTRAMMLSIGDGSTHTLMGDSLRSHRWHEYYPELIGPLADGQYTAVITNPPFGKNLKFKASDSRDADLSIANAAAMKGSHDYVSLEIGLIFLQRSYKLLRVGGRVGIVLPETYFFSHSYRWLHDWLDGRLELRGLLNIPMEAFQEFCRAKTNFYIFEKVG